ncbi:hypothetical protein C6P40_003850 [Pichia californica]|uniref:Protein kinase domain-containing protein n=1 Tax=Pichia californica TaxID=460514 RepID=A0A9P6WN02_9ASCO|nr:hypothetical protein C6P42_004370 [[Candida] californica]KAG0690087.1 hypothetical protein C6P40_003850 [[Candida] californica]
MRDKYQDYTLTYDEFIEYNHKHQLLGRGGFGKVFKTTDSKNNVYAMKIIDIKEVTHRYMLETPMKPRINKHERYDNFQFRKHILTSLLNEVKIMKNLQHPNIISIYHYYMDDNDDTNNNNNNNNIDDDDDNDKDKILSTPQRNPINSQNLYIIMEYSSHGSLLQYIRSQPNRHISEFVSSGITLNILDGLAYLASLSIIHGDIKAANLLIFPKGIIKLCDFGLSFQWDDENSDDYNEDVQDDNKRLQKIATNGSAYWLAPEIILHRMATPKSDIWSLGSTIIEMLTGYPPFSKKGPLSACHAVGSGTKVEYPIGLSKDCISFLDECFQYDPTLRSRAKTLQNHNWIKHTKKNILEFVEIDNDSDNNDTDLGLEYDKINDMEFKRNKNPVSFKKNKTQLDSFKEKHEDFQFNESELDVSLLEITNNKESYNNFTTIKKLYQINQLKLEELKHINVIEEMMDMDELREHYIPMVMKLLLKSPDIPDRIARTEQLLRIGKEFLRMHPLQLRQLCLSGCLVPLAIAKQEHRLNIETIRLVQKLVLGTFKTRGEEWLSASGFKAL